MHPILDWIIGFRDSFLFFSVLHAIAFSAKEGLSNNIVRSILEDKSGNLWFGTQRGGVSRFDGINFTHYTKKEGLSNNTVRSILEDKSGNLWFGTNGGGVSRYDGTNFTHYNEKEGLSNNKVYSILEDKSGNLWFGTYGGGVSRHDGISFTHYTENEGLSNNYVLSILEDKSGNLWFGTNGGGVSRFDGINFTHFTEKEGLSNNYVLSILEDKSGNLWFGTSGGVSRYDGINFTHFTENEGLSNNYVLSILEDKSGNLWFGTNGGGVSRFDGINFTHFTEKEGLSNNYVLSILEDKSGNLWFGASGGVSRYDGINFTHFTEKEGLSNNTVWSLLEDNGGNLWFGTQGGGVSRFDGTNFTHYTEKEGLSNNTVWSLLEDNGGNLWISTEKGLNYFVFEEGEVLQLQNAKQNKKDTEHPEIIVLENQDGLRAMDFWNNSALIDGKNLAWWGSGKSLVMLDLNKFTVPTEPPAIYLRQLDINEQFIDYRLLQDSSSKEMVYDAITTFENYPLNLELPYTKNHLTFHYSAIDWAAPHKIKYSYKLEGLNNNWNIPTEDTKADYRNLSYGTYTFKVKAIGIAQEWSEPFDYTFTILPPWWHTWWARILYVLGFAAIIGAYAQFRSRRLTQENTKLEAKINQRTNELKQSLDTIKATQKQLIQSEKMASLGELTAGIAHEIQNPLNFVNNFSEVNSELIAEMKQEIDKGNLDDVKALANNIDENEQKIIFHGKRADAIVKGMLQHSRSSSGVKEPTDINALADEYLRLAYHGLRAKDKSFNATMKTDFDESIGLINVIPQDIGRVILNLITNAFYAVTEKKNTSTGSVTGYEPTVSVSTKKIMSPVAELSNRMSKGVEASEDLGVEVRIKDNGNGIPQKALDKIFQPFFTTKPTGQGTGLGLSLSYDIVKAHGGDIKVENMEGEGATFFVFLPTK